MFKFEPTRDLAAPPLATAQLGPYGSRPLMQAFIDACHAAPSFAKLRQLLPEVIANHATHARFLNTLSLLEYIGVRKMVKARNTAHLDLEGLHHVLEESTHALRLKKAAHSLAAANVDTYDSPFLLGEGAAERYFQSVDSACAQQLDTQAQSAPRRPLSAYLLTSAAIEVRARCLYPEYQTALRSAGSQISVASILTDEEKHLEQMAKRLPAHIPQWRTALGNALQEEESAFDRLVQVWSAAAQQGVSPQ